MPIYEYQSLDPATACSRCLEAFEVIHPSGNTPLDRCPSCGGTVRRMVSWCRGTVGDSLDAFSRLERRVRGFEKEQKWSHAAELADKGAEKLGNVSLQNRALENYKRAGYALGSLEKHAQKKLQTGSIPGQPST